MVNKFIIRDLPVIKANTNFNYRGIKNKRITKETVRALATGLNKIYDEHGDDAVNFDMEMLSRASGIATETLRDNCKTPTGARIICEGVFIREMFEQQGVLERTKSVTKGEITEANLNDFFNKVATWCYDPTAKEIVKLLTRGVNPDVWHLAFETSYDIIFPDRDKYSEESKQQQNRKLAALFCMDFAEWSRSGISLMYQERFMSRLADDVKFMKYAIEKKAEQLL